LPPGSDTLSCPCIVYERPGGDKSLQLRPHTSVLDRPHLDQSEVQHLLPRGKGEWIRSIGPIGLADKGMHWVAISVDLTTERIVGLPDVWRARLQPVILKEARSHEASLDRDARALVWTPPPKSDVSDPLQPPPPLWPVRLSREDLLFSAPDHAHYRMPATPHSRLGLIRLPGAVHRGREAAAKASRRPRQLR
jgi:hypothetical protein